MATVPVSQSYNGVLVASADAGLREKIVASLNTNRWPVLAAHGGADALGKLESSECDVLLLDRRLPDLDADELINIIREQYASGQVDKRRVGRLAQAIEGGFQDLGAFSSSRRDSSSADASVVPGNATAPAHKVGKPPQADRLRAEIERSLASEISRRLVAVSVGPDGLVLSLREVGFFDSGSAELRSSGKDAFRRIAGVLSEHPYRLRVEGHTDDVPIHNSRFSSNWELSTARATEIVRILVIQYGFLPKNLSAAGYAEFHPAADNATEEGRQANRRVDIVVLNSQMAAETLQ
jgi:chemotaxis protein MotB